MQPPVWKVVRPNVMDKTLDWHGSPHQWSDDKNNAARWAHGCPESKHFLGVRRMTSSAEGRNKMVGFLKKFVTEIFHQGSIARSQHKSGKRRERGDCRHVWMKNKIQAFTRNKGSHDEDNNKCKI